MAKPNLSEIKALVRRVARELREASPPPLPAKHPRFALIGRVAAEWSHLEYALDLIIWNMTGLSNSVASSLTGQIGQQAAKFRVILALINSMNLKKHLPSDYVKKTITPLMGRVTAAADERNRIVHDPWFGFPRVRNARQLRSTSSKGTPYGMVAIPRSEIMSTIQRIVDRKQDISRVHIQIEAALVASGRKLPAPNPAFLLQSAVTSRSPIAPGLRMPPSRGLTARSRTKGLF